MKSDLIHHIICPVCGTLFKLESERKNKDEVLDGLLLCQKGHKFKISNGIPRLVTDQTENFIKTENAFSSKWKRYNKFYHDKKWYNLQRNWFLDRFGWKNINHFNKFLQRCEMILDAGTGIGNSAKLFSSNLHSKVFAVDASDSIDFAYKKYGKVENIHFIQADIRQLPFRRQFFDFICSDQVLHHTKNAQTSFKYLTRHLKKNGLISIYVYNKKAPMREFADDFIRKKTIKMTEEECAEFSKKMAYLGKVLSQIKKKIKIPFDIPILEIKAGTYDVQRFVYWNFLKCFWADDGNWERSVGVNFDWYFPKYASRHTPSEVRKWYKDAGLKINHFNEVESGISVSGEKI